MIQERTIRRQIPYGNLEEVLLLSERKFMPSINFPRCICLLKLKETIRTNYYYIYVVLHYRSMIIFNLLTVRN